MKKFFDDLDVLKKSSRNTYTFMEYLNSSERSFAISGKGSEYKELKNPIQRNDKPIERTYELESVLKNIINYKKNYDERDMANKWNL